MMNRAAFFFAGAALSALLWSCASQGVLPRFVGASSPALREHVRSATTVMFEIPSPDPAQAQKVLVTLRQSNRTHRVTLGLVPGGHFCHPAPVIGSRCWFSVRLGRAKVDYTLQIFDDKNRLRYTRSDTWSDSYAEPFVVSNRYNGVRVAFVDPTMGSPSRTRLDISPGYQNTKEQISGLIVWPGKLLKPIHLYDGDKSGATSLSRTTVSSLVNDQVDLLYDGKSFVNPWIGADHDRSQLFVPFLRTQEYVLPSHKRTFTNSGHGRMFVNADGSITFLEFKGVGTIDTSGTITEIHTSYEYDIAKGPDGRIWELAQAKGRSSEVLARVNDDGTLTQYPLPDWVYGSMVLGPDGNFWMATERANTVRRISPAGVITDFRVGGKNIDLFDLAAGGDGNLWFVGSRQATGRKPTIPAIVKVGTGGQPASYFLPVQAAGTEAGVENPIWSKSGLFFSLSYARMGRMEESGSYNELRGHLQMRKPSEGISIPMALGPDRALWFPAMVLGPPCTLGRWTMSGQVAFAQFAAKCPGTQGEPYDQPTAFVAGPHNTLWYTRDDRVGKISL